MKEQMTESVEVAAEALWQSEYVRATGKKRSITWGEVSNETQEQYRFCARAAIEALTGRVTDEMVKRALDAWFDGPQSESDMGLERGMRAAIEAALSGRDSIRTRKMTAAEQGQMEKATRELDAEIDAELKRR